MAGTCAGSLMAELFAEIFSFCNDWILPAADFQFVAVRVLKKEPVIAGTVIDANFWTFQILPADFARQLCDAVDFVSRIRPKRAARPVGLITSIFGEAKNIRGHIFSG